MTPILCMNWPCYNRTLDIHRDTRLPYTRLLYVVWCCHHWSCTYVVFSASLLFLWHSLPLFLCRILCFVLCFALISMLLSACSISVSFSAMAFSKMSKDLANELMLVPWPCAANKNQKQMILTVLDLSDVTRAIMEQHIAIVGLDKHLFQHTIDDQSNALHFCHLFAKICKQTMHIKCWWHRECIYPTRLIVISIPNTLYSILHQVWSIWRL